MPERRPLCHGAEDHEGRPMCEGARVRRTTFRAPDATRASGYSERHQADWCRGCRDAARAAGYLILALGERRTQSYPCRNAVNGCKRRVSFANEHCTTSCCMEYLGESSHSFPLRGERAD